MIAQSTIDEIKNRIDIVEVVSDFVQLKKSGSSYKALSPFTAEKTPSFYVVPSKGIFKCFSSGKGGDAITFVQEMDGLSYLEALKYLAAKYGIEVQEEEQTDEQLAEQNKRESLFIILNFAADHFQEILKTHEEGISVGKTYLTERKISDDSLEKFKLGYSLNVWDHLYQEALKRGYNEDLLEEAGLIVRKENKVYDRFRGRVIFPIHNITGKVVAFGARILVSDKKQPKYLNSPETELYHKSRILYGLYQGKQSIRQEDNCYIVEGYTDVIAMHQVGVENVVSSSGTALTAEQAKLIKRYTQNVTIIFDGDAAGIRASFRGIDILLENGLNVKAIVLPEGEDPDSYSKTLGTTAFKHFLEDSATDFIRFKTSLLLDEIAGDPIRKAEVIRDIVASVAKIDDAIKRSVYIKECSSLLDISESVLIVELNKFLLEKRKSQGEAPPVSVQAPEEGMPIEDEQVDTSGEEKIAFQEKEAIRVLLNFGTEKVFDGDNGEIYVIEYYLRETEEVEFIHRTYQRILGLIESMWKLNQSIDIEKMIHDESPQVKNTVVDLITPRYEISEFWKTKYGIHVPKERDILKEVIYSNVLRLKQRNIQHIYHLRIEDLKKVTEEEKVEVLEDLNHIKAIEMQIADVLGNVTVK
jgi:DNA primase